MKKISRKLIKNITFRNINHISDEEQDEMAIPSYLHWNPLIRWLMWKRYEKIELLFDEKETNSVLEFGCGLGLLLPDLSTRFKNVYAIDLHTEYAKEICHEFSLKNVMFIDDLDVIADNSLDSIIAADVLEHVDNLTETIKKISQKLKPKGSCIISGPTENIAYQIGRFLAGFSDKGDYHHTDIDGVISTLCSLNFHIEKTIYLPNSYFPRLFKICRLCNT